MVIILIIAFSGSDEKNNQEANIIQSVNTRLEQPADLEQPTDSEQLKEEEQEPVESKPTLDEIFKKEPEPTPKYTCSYNAYNCDDFSTHRQAQGVYEYCGGISNDVHGLDRDKDGSACETLP